jgi:hypothetical protein
MAADLRSNLLWAASLDSNVNTATNAQFRRPPGYVNTYALVANTAQTITIPAGAYIAMFNASTTAGTASIPFYVSDSSILTPAVVPTGTVTNGLSCEWMPSIYNVSLTTALSVISPNSGYLYVTFYGSPSVAQAA